MITKTDLCQLGGQFMLKRKKNTKAQCILHVLLMYADR